jgi:hypothetical protein
MFTINRTSYTLVASNSTQPETNNAFILMPPYNEEEYLAVLVTMDDPCTSVNWNSHMQSTSTPALPECVYSGRTPIARINKCPFILDTGATCHISPEASNFKVLKAILYCPVKGLCGSAIYVVGMGDIDLCIAGGHVLKLTDVLYIPESSI